MIHERLRLARETKGWSLEELSRRAGIRPRTLELIERGQFAELPAGLYCRSSIRSYASAVGLNADEVLEVLRPVLPTGEDPLDGLARRHGHSRKAEPKPQELPLAPAPAARASLVPLPSSPPPEAPELAMPVVVRTAAPWADGEQPRLWSASPADAEVADILLRPAAAAGLERIETPGAATSPGRLTFGDSRPWWRPLAASAIDGALLAAMGWALVWLTAIACGTSLLVALRIAAPGLAVVFALIVALYFVLFGGVGNATLGVSLMHLDVPPPGRIVLNPRDVFGRARRSIFHDSTLLAE